MFLVRDFSWLIHTTFNQSNDVDNTLQNSPIYIGIRIKTLKAYVSFSNGFNFIEQNLKTTLLIFYLSPYA